MEEIRNKVDESGLLQLDLERLIQVPQVLELDLTSFLEGGFLLREKNFRAALKEMDIEPYRSKTVALFCSTDAILPLWSWMLLSLKLQEVEADVYQGSKTEVQKRLVLAQVEAIDHEDYRDKRMIVKGCSEHIPEEAYLRLAQKLQPVVKNLMFGEACSAVPLYKRASK